MMDDSPPKVILAHVNLSQHELAHSVAKTADVSAPGSCEVQRLAVDG